MFIFLFLRKSFFSQEAFSFFFFLREKLESLTTIFCIPFYCTWFQLFDAFKVEKNFVTLKLTSLTKKNGKFYYYFYAIWRFFFVFTIIFTIIFTFTITFTFFIYLYLNFYTYFFFIIYLFAYYIQLRILFLIIFQNSIIRNSNIWFFKLKPFLIENFNVLFFKNEDIPPQKKGFSFGNLFKNDNKCPLEKNY